MIRNEDNCCRARCMPFPRARDGDGGGCGCGGDRSRHVPALRRRIPRPWHDVLMVGSRPPDQLHEREVLRAFAKEVGSCLSFGSA